MNKKSIEERARILHCLVEGNSIRGTARLNNCSKNTVVKLLAEVGYACQKYQSENLVNLPCSRIEVDEIWSFCYAKEKNVPADKKGQLGYGDVWTWTAICADTKLVPSWLVGQRDAEYASAFIQDLSCRLANRVQLTSDGYKAYLGAVEEAFGEDVDYAQLIKLYGAAEIEGQRRYSPSQCHGARKETVTGEPDKKNISTSYVERQNLTMRMAMRRFTRLTNGFSKKIENLDYSVSLHFMYYNFGRIHKTLRVTPAMEAGVADHVWTLEAIASLAE